MVALFRSFCLSSKLCPFTEGDTYEKSLSQSKQFGTEEHASERKRCPRSVQAEWSYLWPTSENRRALLGSGDLPTDVQMGRRSSESWRMGRKDSAFGTTRNIFARWRQKG